MNRQQRLFFSVFIAVVLFLPFAAYTHPTSESGWSSGSGYPQPDHGQTPKAPTWHLHFPASQGCEDVWDRYEHLYPTHCECCPDGGTIWVSRGSRRTAERAVTSMTQPEQPVEPESELEEETIPVQPKLPVETISYAISYAITFIEGIHAYHLPVHSGTIWLTDLFEMLVPEVVEIRALRPTVQAWTVVRNEHSKSDEWISQYRGLLIGMDEDKTIVLTAPKLAYGYSIMYLKEGDNLVGIPRKSEYLKKVGDLFKRFGNAVTSVKGYNEGEWAELDKEIELEATVGYLVTADKDVELVVWGEQWIQSVAMAPAAQWAYYKKMATTWAAVKTNH